MRIHVLIQDLEGLVALQQAVEEASGEVRDCHLHICGSWEQLVQGAREGKVELAVVQPLFSTPGRVTPSIAINLGRIEAVFGDGGPILFLGRTEAERGILSHLAASRFRFVLVQGDDNDPRRIIRLLSRAEGFRIISMTEFLADSAKAPRALRSLTSLLTGWPPPESARGVAEGFNVSPRTLRRHMAELGLITPRRAIRWGRLLEAALIWRMGVRSRKRIASIVGLADVPTLAHLCRDLTGVGLDRILAVGGPEEVLEGLGRELST